MPYLVAELHEVGAEVNGDRPRYVDNRANRPFLHHTDRLGVRRQRNKQLSHGTSKYAGGGLFVDHLSIHSELRRTFR